jgi:hypothetical protein
MWDFTARLEVGDKEIGDEVKITLKLVDETIKKCEDYFEFKMERKWKSKTLKT